jgi:hypothetical protein
MAPGVVWQCGSDALHELLYSGRAGNSMTVLLPGLRKATSDERENDSGAAIELEGCHVAVGAGSSTPEDRVSICISMIATQDHAFLPSSHYNNNNLQGIQQFPLYALLNISSSQSLNYSNQPTATTTTTSAIPTFRSRQRSKQTVRKDFSVSFVNLKLFSCLRAFSYISFVGTSPQKYLHYQIYYYNISNGPCMFHNLSSSRSSTDFLQGGYN